MLKARIFALCGVSIVLLGLFSPVLAITSYSQTSGEEKENIHLEPTNLSSTCSICNQQEKAFPQTFSPDRHGVPLIRLRSGAFDPLQLSSAESNLQQNVPSKSGATLHLIQFTGPIQENWYQVMVAAGLEVVTYIPDFTYLVFGEGHLLSVVRSRVPVRWLGEFQPQYALHPKLKELFFTHDDVEVVVQLFNSDNPNDRIEIKHTTAAMSLRAVAVVRPPMRIRDYTYLSLMVSPTDLNWIVAQPYVMNVEPLLHPRLADEIQGQILAGHLTTDGSRPYGPGYLSWLTQTIGFSQNPTEYPIVDITDDGIDDGDATPIHADFYEFGETSRNDRLIYNANWTSDPSADSVGGHGNLNASIAGGYNNQSGAAYEDNEGYNYGLGINPFVPIAGSKVFGNTSGWANPVYADIIEYGYTQGARISSNSWGDDVGTGQYQTDDQIYDMLVRDAVASMPGNQEMTVVFSAGNDGSRPTTIGSPGNAKNVITVGASESYRPTWIDGCWIGTTSADNANDIANFSSRGPTADGRIKPDIVAPGTHIIGAATQIPAYTGEYVCDKYYPTGQTLYAASSGTSHAAPAVAGAASLFYNDYKNHYSETNSWPSPAMTKASLINAALYLDGVSSGDTLPSPHQGFGAANLGTAFDGTPRLFEDQTKVFQQSGEYTTIRGFISDSERPFRVSLVWTDAPGPVIGDAFVNDLNLVVHVGGQTYLGNVFSGSTSISGGDPDTRNNIESVFLPTGLQGAFEITIMANNIAGDGVPGNNDPTDQDYALICYNCVKSDSISLEITPQQQIICAGDDAVYNVASTNYLEYPVNIDLHASGYPTPSIVTFNPNPTPAGNPSTMTLMNTTQVSTGLYDIGITGETLTHTQVVTVQLQVFDSVPDTVSLVSPTDMAYDIPVHPTLSWTAAVNTNLYAVNVSTNTSFTNPIYNAVTDKLTHTVQINLEYETDYYWRVTPQNICGAASPSETRRFTTQIAPLTVIQTPDLPIPDMDPNGISDTMRITDDGTLIDLDVAISITHSWVGDLRISLEHFETSTSIDLIDRPGVTNPDVELGCSGSNIDIVLDDAAPLTVEENCQNDANAFPPGTRYSPNLPLAVFNGQAWKGNWILRVYDHAAMDIGTLNQWSLIPTLSTNTDNTVSFQQDSFNVTKNRPTATVTVTLASTPASTVTVEYATEPGSAVPGTDYMTATGLLTFVHTPLQTFSVPILDNPKNEISRTLILSLHNPMNATLAEPYTTPLHIIAPEKEYFFYLQLILKHYP